MKLWQPSAEQGNAIAQSNLGLMYANVEGVPKDDMEAAKWYRLAAEQGDAMAQAAIGYMYNNGKGVPEDKVLAYMWWNLAAAQGFEKANISKLAIEKKMSSSEIQAAKKLSKDCVKKYYIDC